MRDLIEELKKATRPDRELDAAIMRAAFAADVWSYDDNCHIDAQIKNGLWDKSREQHPDFDSETRVTWRYHKGEVGTVKSEYGELPNYTASIDAAFALIPAGWQVILYTETGCAELYDATLQKRQRKGIQARATNAASPAIALCIAALKAREVALSKGTS